MKATKEQNQKIRNYILSAIDLSGYDEYKEIQMSEVDRVKTMYSIFKKEYGFPENLRYYGNEQKTFENWLMGLPSCFNVDFENYHILRLGREWGFLPAQTSEEARQDKRLSKIIARKEDQFLEFWWARIAMTVKAILERGIPKPKPERKTVDEYQIHGFYSGQWEEVTSEDSFKEAKYRLKEYRENEVGTSFKIVKKRIKKTPLVP